MTPSPQALFPILLNEKSNEPYLRLPPPHSNIIITPPRQTDADRIVELLNDRRVADWLGTRYPYLIDNARQWMGRLNNDMEKIMDELETKPIGEAVGGCPVRFLREVTDSGEAIFIGDCGIVEWGFDDVMDPEERKRLANENSERPPGHPDKEWVFGDWVAPSHQGKGIMSLVIKTLMEEWVVPKMGATKVNAATYTGNIGSVKVFEKNGFHMEKTIENCLTLPEEKGGRTVGIHVLRWRRREAQSESEGP